jgi:hypothetical protein
MRRTLLLALLGVALPVVGCGGSGGGGGGDGALIGQLEYALALPGTGETVTLGLRNVSTDPALVTATLHSPAGGAGTPIAIPGGLVPGRGEVQVNVSSPPENGWIHVETRDPVTHALFPTSGFVVPYVQKQGAGPRGEFGFGLPFATTTAAMPFGPDTTVVQVINASHLTAVPPVTPVAIAADVAVFDTDGTILGFIPAAPIPANGVFVVPGVPAGSAGQVAVTPLPAAGVDVKFTMATREDPAGFGEAIGFGLDSDIHVQQTGPGNFYELALEWGRTPEDDFRDFAILATNATDGALTIQFDEINDATGGAILPFPRVFTLGARETRYFGTTLANTIGLEIGEVHPFADLFGDVFLTAGLRQMRWALVHAPGVVVTAPNFDPAFSAAYQEVPETEISISAAVVGIEQETTTFGAERNWIAMTNRSTAEARVFVRIFTPGGTEYLLPDLFVPPGGRFDWSPDALVLNGLLGIREDQNVPTDPPVPFFSVYLASTTGLGFFGRREIRDALGNLVLVTPHVVELLDDAP